MALRRNQSLSLIHHGHKKRCRSSLLSLPVQSPSITLKPTVSPLKKPHFLSFIIFLIRLCYSSLLPLLTSETSSSLKNKEYLCNHTSIHALSLSVTILIKTPLRKCCNSIILLGKISQLQHAPTLSLCSILLPSQEINPDMHIKFGNRPQFKPVLQKSATLTKLNQLQQVN